MPTVIQQVAPTSWQEYQLLDSGEGEKLERFGEFILIRPEPQAIWSRTWPTEKWQAQAHAHFSREQQDKFRYSDEVKGGWKKLKPMPDSWQVQYRYSDLTLTLRLALTSFGHVGVFPEQGDNWNFIYDRVRSWQMVGPKVLNLFAYTGAASVVARMAGAEVTHVDASRPGLNWANQNMQLNHQRDIRWVYEDAFKFVKREVKRGHRYNGIIMDPPPYGRGPEGEKWMLVDQLQHLLLEARALLQPEQQFFVLSMYAVGLSSVVGVNTAIKAGFDPKESGEFVLPGLVGPPLPMGTFLRA
jgi:23S rRNA (cytosine1962-C5)-methyltransferase